MVKQKSPLILLLLCLSISLFLFIKTGYDVFFTETEIPKIQCTSYSPYITNINDYTRRDQIERDLKIIKRYTSCIRIYTTKNGLDVVPEVAQSLNMTVILGTWIDKVSLTQNLKDIDKAIELANGFDNIKMIVVGNEVSISNWSRIDKVTYVSYLKYIKSKTTKPIAITGLLYDLLDQYQLFEHVDIVGLHIFPYWQNENPVEKGVELTVAEVNKLKHFIEKDLSLNKEIQVLEYGQPWMGLTKGENTSSFYDQRTYIKEVSEKLSELGIFSNYYELLSEKRANDLDGYLYRLWGLLIDDGVNIIEFQKKLFSVVVVLVLMFIFIIMFLSRKLQIVKKVEYVLCVINLSIILGYVLYIISSIYRKDFIHIQIYIVLSLVLSILVFLKLITEFYLFKPTEKFNIDGIDLDEMEKSFRKVSIIIPSKSEDLNIIDKTIKACLNQTYSNIEVIFVNNGEQKEGYKEKLDSMLQSCLDPRLISLYFENVKKNKSGVLNHALKYVSDDSSHILYIDVDYIIKDYAVEFGLKQFINPEVSVVQFPQIYSKADGFISEMARIEQEYVADLSQPIRNNSNTVILNGTMCFFKKDIFKEHVWDEGTICEDAMLGVDIQIDGKKVVYVNKNLGEGIAPRNFGELIIQRFRWAAGASQVMKKVIFSKTIYKNPKLLLHYIWGWLYWISLVAILLYTLFYLFFFWYIERFQHYFLTTAPINYIYMYLLLFFSIFTFMFLHEKYKLSMKTFFKFALFQLALINTIAIGIIYGIFVKKISFISTRSEIKSNIYYWVLPLLISYLLILILYKMYTREIYIEHFNTQINTLIPVILTLIPQLAQLSLYLIDKTQK